VQKRCFTQMQLLGFHELLCVLFQENTNCNPPPPTVRGGVIWQPTVHTPKNTYAIRRLHSRTHYMLTFNNFDRKSTQSIQSRALHTHHGLSQAVVTRRFGRFWR